MLKFTTEDKQKSKIQIVEQDIVPNTFDDSQLPTDVHIITYVLLTTRLTSMLSGLTQWWTSLMNTMISSLAKEKSNQSAVDLGESSLSSTEKSLTTEADLDTPSY